MDFARDESGTVLVEYALVLALLSFALIGGMTFMENRCFVTLSNFQNELTNYSLRNNL
jgi:Flp pilus assembly pilin Flp